MSDTVLIPPLRTALTALSVVDQRAIVAVSGGADSVALLYGLITLRDELSLSLIVAHYHHRLRGDEADADAAWVEQLAITHGLPFCLGLATTATDPHAAGVETRARKQRYAFLKQVAKEHHAPTIMTAHTADDLVETVLHHLFRGTGVAGLRGIPRERTLGDGVRLVRPLLSASRRDVEDYLAEIGQSFRTDSTNADPHYRRNWLRHCLLPLIHDKYPHATAAVTRLSQQAAELAAALADWAHRLLHAAILDHTADTVRLKRSALTGLPRHVQREVFVRLWERQHWPRDRMTAVDWDRAVDLIDGNITAATLPGGVMLTARADLLIVTLPVAQSLPPD
ncbi:MAG TPA: tRNA lysidine(34) synthetase TilS [Planctomycetaceae bacterium]|nr:tRNA lysidine(34) synthetase TilS [Planctomycetaceae bacterium]